MAVVIRANNNNSDINWFADSYADNSNQIRMHYIVDT